MLENRDFVVIVLALAALLAPVQARADRSAPPDFTTNRIDSLHERPAQWHVEGSLTLRLDVDSDSPSNQASIHTTAGLAAANVAVGLRDDLLVSVGEQYLVLDDREQTGYRAIGASGFGDPFLYVNYRYLGGLTGRFFSSVGLEVSPSIGHGTVGDPARDGNDLRGSTLLALNDDTYAVFGDLELVLTAEVLGETDAQYDDPNPQYDESRDGYVTAYVVPGLRYHLDLIFLEAFVRVDPALTRTYHLFNSPLASVIQTQLPWRVTPELGLGWTDGEHATVEFLAQYSGATESVIRPGQLPPTQADALGSWSVLVVVGLRP